MNQYLQIIILIKKLKKHHKKSQIILYILIHVNQFQCYLVQEKEHNQQYYMYKSKFMYLF